MLSCVLETIYQVSIYVARVFSVRYVLRHTVGITGTGHFGKFGTLIQVPDTLDKSVRHPTDTEHFGTFGTIGYRYHRYLYRRS